MDVLLEFGADVHACNKYDETALMHTDGTRIGLEILDKIRARGADVNARNFKGETLLDKATKDETYQFLVIEDRWHNTDEPMSSSRSKAREYVRVWTAALVARGAVSGKNARALRRFRRARLVGR